MLIVGSLGLFGVNGESYEGIVCFTFRIDCIVVFIECLCKLFLQTLLVPVLSILNKANESFGQDLLFVQLLNIAQHGLFADFLSLIHL